MEAEITLCTLHVSLSSRRVTKVIGVNVIQKRSRNFEYLDPLIARWERLSSVKSSTGSEIKINWMLSFIISMGRRKVRKISEINGDNFSFLKSPNGINKQTTKPISILFEWKLAVTKDHNESRNKRIRDSLIKFVIRFLGKGDLRVTEQRPEKVHQPNPMFV